MVVTILSGEPLPVRFEIRLGVNPVVDPRIELLDIGTQFAVVAVDMDPARVVRCGVDLRYFDTASVSASKKEDHRKRFDGVETGVGTNTDTEHASPNLRYQIVAVGELRVRHRFHRFPTNSALDG